MQVHIYEEQTASLDFHKLANYLKEKLPSFSVEIREAFFAFFRPLDIARLAEELARAKVRSLTSRDFSFEPLPGEIAYERRRLEDPKSKAFGILYDGFKLGKIMLGLIPEKERTMEHIHVVFTNQLFGTWEEGDGRYHARVSVYGFPSLISTTGIVEAPAKPREYYLLKRQYSALGFGELAAALELKERYKGRFLDYDDPRLTDVMKGYLMQAIFYHLTGDPFCEDPGCRLYNAHWQEEVIRAQLESDYEFCPFHQAVLVRVNYLLLKQGACACPRPQFPMGFGFIGRHDRPVDGRPTQSGHAPPGKVPGSV
jgi:hypothetical protein